jgi:hypothetical protein
MSAKSKCMSMVKIKMRNSFAVFSGVYKYVQIENQFQWDYIENPHFKAKTIQDGVLFCF